MEEIASVNAIFNTIIEKYAVLLFVGIFVVGFIVMWIKASLDEKKGEKSNEKETVRNIIRRIVPQGEDYIPVYAYWRSTASSRYVKSYRCFAIGLTKDKMYVAPLTIAGNTIGYDTPIVIAKEEVGKIELNEPDSAIHFVKIYDTNGTLLLDCSVSEKNTKIDKSYPVNITQPDEAGAFRERLEEWKRQHMSHIEK